MPSVATSLDLDPPANEGMQRSFKEAREQLLRDAQAAWSHYQATGLHVTADEADAWMAKLEAGENAPPPECHV